MNRLIADLNRQIVEECIDYFVIATQGRLEREDVVRHIADIVNCTGGDIDACHHCGAMPLTVNCNNAGCDV